MDVLGFLAVCMTLSTLLFGQQPNRTRAPIVRSNATTQISDHVYVILDDDVGGVPNVGIVVGDDATLVVDTGLGPRNAPIILGEVAKVRRGPGGLHIVSTHFHPEHALGESGFPATAQVLRARAQQDDINEFGLSLADAFARRSTAMAELLEGVTFREADAIFDQDNDPKPRESECKVVLARPCPHSRRHADLR